MSHNNTAHLGAARSEALYRDSVRRFNKDNKDAWNDYLISALPIAEKYSSDAEEIAEKAAEIASALLRQLRLHWDD